MHESAELILKNFFFFSILKKFHYQLKKKYIIYYCFPNTTNLYKK